MKNMKKVLALSLVIVSVLAIAIPAFAAVYTTRVKVNTNLAGGSGGILNLRKSPSSSALVLKKIPNGATIYINDQPSEWVGATYDNAEGFVMRKFLEIGGTTPDTGYITVFSDSTLKKGHSGNAVWNLQQYLKKAGSAYDPGTVDGDFGTNTLNAVVKYQDDHGLDPDGQVGPKTKFHLYENVKSVPNLRYPATVE